MRSGARIYGLYCSCGWVGRARSERALADVGEEHIAYTDWLWLEAEKQQRTAEGKAPAPTI